MSFQILYPSPKLAPYIKMYWTMKGSVKSGEQHIQRIIPNGLTEIIFYQNDVPESSTKNGFLKDKSQISGQKNIPFDLIVSGQIKLFSILFKPHGISRFFNIPASELFNQTIPLRYLLGSQLDKIEDELFEATSNSEQVAIVEKLLLQLSAKRESYKLPRITESVIQINAENENKTIPDLAAVACLSRKQFERNFTELIGISPKQFMKVIRFQRALFIQQNNSNLKLTELACNVGYFDQSHMISDFKELSGFTPGQYFQQCSAYSDYFSN